jgi:predicted GIY-YIG superfamily endonuclease
MKPYKWTDDALQSEASKYEALGDFKRANPSAYNMAWRTKRLHIVEAVAPRQRKKWTKDEVLTIAAGYSTKQEFREGAPAAHAAAYRLGWLGEAAVDMEIAATGVNNHLIYRIAFPDGAVYFGLSCSLEERLRYHWRRGAPHDHKKATGLDPSEVTVLEQGLSPHEAQAHECEYIRLAREQGLLVLNRHTGGGLGAFGRLHLSKENVLERASHFHSRQQFRDGDRIAYLRAKRMGWFAEACRHMGGQRRSLTTADLTKIASKYPTRA